jgi:hypothetical protein
MEPANSGLRVEHGTAVGTRLVTTVPRKAGEAIARFVGCMQVEQPTRYSIQTGPASHIDDLGILANLNHSCAPSALVDTERLVLVAARDLAAGEELTFFYPSTEWEMTHPFACQCGAPACIGTVRGAKELPQAVLTRYVLNRHIRDLLAARHGGAADSGAVGPLADEDEGKRCASPK